MNHFSHFQTIIIMPKVKKEKNTTTLKDILGALLSDVIRAQHDANSHLQMLSEQYANNGRLSGMKLPTASIGELTLSLNFAITGGIEEKEEEGVNNQGIDKALRYICNEVSELLIKTMVQGIQKSKANYRTDYAFVDTLTSNTDFLRHLRRRFYALLNENKDRLVDKNAQLDEVAVRNILYAAAEEQLLDHEDIRNFFLQEDAAGLREKIYKEFDRVLKKELDDIMRESSMQSFRCIQRYGSLNVEIDNNALAQLPPSAVQTMTITITPPDKITVK